MKLSILMPVYNEESTIEQIVNKVFSTKFLCNIELIIVDDKSTDGTLERLLQLSNPEIKIIRHDTNKGKGAAIRSAINNATGDYVIIQDADMEYNPEDINTLLKKAMEGYDAIYGSRFYNGRSEGEKLFHYLGNKLLTSISNLFSGLNLTDMETCYKMIKREVFDKITIEENRFGIEPELTAKLAKSGMRIIEVPISYNARTYSEGKKIGLKDAFRTIFCIMKYNL